jgi:putative spermidine/putrescine transport system ATP-binding protein
VSGDAAVAVIGRAGTFTIRPEKIRVADRDAPVEADQGSATGVIRSVVYLGSETRYHVELDAGPGVVVTEQNTQASSMEALASQGRAVRLIWKRHHVLALADHD